MDIDIFYEKFNEIVNARKAMKLDIDVKLYEIIFTSMDQQFRNILKGFLFFLAPLIFPFLLYRSSIGKIFKSKSIGELYGQRPNIYFEDIAGLGNAKLEVS